MNLSMLSVLKRLMLCLFGVAGIVLAITFSSCDGKVNLTPGGCDTFKGESRDNLFSLLNIVLGFKQPHLRLNQFDIDIENPPHKKNDNWIRLGGTIIPIDDFNPAKKLRRSWYINDFNSKRWELFPYPYGLGIRIFFETDGKEIKGWCHGCLVGSSDGRAPDGHIKAKSADLPFFELAMEAERKDGGFIFLKWKEVKVDMKVELGGFRGLFENHLNKKVKSKIIESFEDNWQDIQENLGEVFTEALKMKLKSEDGSDIIISDIDFLKDGIKVCTEVIE